MRDMKFGWKKKKEKKKKLNINPRRNFIGFAHRASIKLNKSEYKSIKDKLDSKGFVNSSPRFLDRAKPTYPTMVEDRKVKVCQLAKAEHVSVRGSLMARIEVERLEEEGALTRQ